MKYSVNFRIWHWLNTIVILGLLGTVFLRKTFLSWRTNSELLTNKLLEMNIEITDNQAKILAKALRSEMWEWHIILGYALLFLLLYRFYLYFQDTSQREPFWSLSLHKTGVRALYYVVYTSIIFMSISGFIIYFHQTLGIDKDMTHIIKEIHELVFNIILIFVPLHIAGVIIAENRNDKGIISTMVNGEEGF